jgi:hypothetical protein
MDFTQILVNCQNALGSTCPKTTVGQKQWDDKDSLDELDMAANSNCFAENNNGSGCPTNKQVSILNLPMIQLSGLVSALPMNSILKVLSDASISHYLCKEMME